MLRICSSDGRSSQTHNRGASSAGRSKSYFHPSVTHIPQESIYAASAVPNGEEPPQWITQADIELVFEQAAGGGGGGTVESITLLDFLAVMMNGGVAVGGGRFDRHDDGPQMASSSGEQLPLDSEDANTNGAGGGAIGRGSRNGKRFSAVFGRRSASALIVGGGGHHAHHHSAQEELNLTEMGGAARSVL